MIYKPYKQILNYKNHILIAGTTGAGKSVLLNGLIHTGLQLPEKQFVFIDLKKVELNFYKDCKKTYYYTDNYSDLEYCFNSLVNTMYSRLNYMQKARLKNYNGNTIYVIIDEFCDIVFNCKSVLNQISLIAAIGRAAGIILVIATQRPTNDIITPLIKANTPVKIGLRTSNKQESRNIIYSDICYDLPLYGYGYIIAPELKEPHLLTIPLIPDNQIMQDIKSL